MDGPGLETVRLDKWLWAVRLFKTRGLATTACRAGHVRLGDHALKPSREIRPGDVLIVRAGDMTRTVKVLTPLERRVSAAEVPSHLEDLTPPEERERARAARAAAPGVLQRPRGAGRPTKRERRVLEAWLQHPAPEP